MSAIELARWSASLHARARARWPWLLLLTCCLLLTLGALTPWLIGRWAEQTYQGLLDDLAERGYVAVEQAYRRGWFEASAVTLIAPATAIDARDPQRLLSPRLHIVSRIEHGPRALGRWPPPLLSVRNRISVIGAPRALPALVLEGRLGLGGALDLQLRLPDVTYAGAAADLHLVDGRSDLALAPGGRRLRLSGALRLLEAQDPDAGALALHSSAWTLSLRRGDDGLPVGTLLLGMDAMRLDAAAPAATTEPFALNGRALQLALELTRSDDHLALQATLDLEHLDLPGLVLGPSRLVLRLERLSAAALRALVAAERALAARRLPGSLYGFALAGLLAEQVPVLLAAGPTLRLEDLTLATADGPLSAALTLRLPPAPDESADASPDWAPDRAADGAPDSPPGASAPVALALGEYLQPDFWLGRLAGEGHLLVPQPLLARWIGAQQRARVRGELARQGIRLGAMPAELEAEVAAATDAALLALLRDRWLVAREGRLGAVLVLGDGLLTINGKTLPLSGLSVPGDR